jgi:hypothetical protein
VGGTTFDKLMENIVTSFAKYRGLKEVNLTQCLSILEQMKPLFSSVQKQV